MTIPTTGTGVVYENRWLRLREDAIEYRDATEGIYGVVEKIDFVVIALEDDQLWLVEQYRYPVRARCSSFPRAPGMTTRAPIPRLSRTGSSRGDRPARELARVARSTAAGGWLLDTGHACVPGHRARARRSAARPRGTGPTARRVLAGEFERMLSTDS